MVNSEKKKKTYVFDNHILALLEELKLITGKSETRIISEALELYEKHIKEEESLKNSLGMLLDKISDLSYKLGQCEAQLDELKRQKN
ncbi:MAG: hypothetical protein GXO22_04400 [Aquificae bacterium]|nr:hypothetical protein [Aquificota bacterium]